MSTDNTFINPLNNTNVKSQKEEYHPIEFYSLGKINPNKLDINIYSNNYQKKLNSKINYNHSSHDLFDRNILSVNHPYFDKYKEVKPRYKISSFDKNENNYLEPLLSLKTRNEDNMESQKQNNINSLEWFHVIKKKVYISDQNSKIRRGNNITTSQFYQEKGISNTPMSKNNDSKGFDFHTGENNTINRIFSIKRFKVNNENLSIQKEHFPKGDEIAQIESENNYWRKLRIVNNSMKNNTCINNNSVDTKKPNEKKLKENFLYFDKNQKNIIRHKNWWKIDP